MEERHKGDLVKIIIAHFYFNCAILHKFINFVQQSYISNFSFILQKTPEERGREFLEYVGRSLHRLRHNLKKNISYDPDTLDDVFGYTVLRVYDAIVKRGVKVEDYEQYFYMSSRLNYIKTEERCRKRRARLTFVSSLPDVAEESPGLNACAVEELRKELESLFGKEITDLFFRFMEAKTTERISYRTFARREGLSPTFVARQIGNIKKYLRN